MGRTAAMHLSEDERTHVQTFVERGEANARNLTRARVLLKSDEGCIDAQIAEALGITEQTVRNTRKRFRTGGVEAVLADKRQQRRRRKALLSEEQAAHLISIASGEVPDGHDHWTVRMLADKAVELGYAQRLSRETVRLLLKKVKMSRPHSGGGSRRDNLPASSTQAKSVHFDVRPSSIRG